ncbi:hypothetical protein B0T22DRAFT_196813 [Podospora appendiculata]|uniref:Uncharacterized protein n=1 Tax=Podospora appendiculata TaxID=314037 RepID=A0AAE0X497_9PEZI|nr:hypothetical protein B0T22DRAFT_196813 [Podospora appendiculata]
MATLPTEHPSLSLHLTDRALTPIISSSSSTTTTTTTNPAPSTSSSSSTTPFPAWTDDPDPDVDPRPETNQATALAVLTATAIAAQNATSRLGFGTAIRIMVELGSSRPVVLSSFLDHPPSLPLAPKNDTGAGAPTTNGGSQQGVLASHGLSSSASRPRTSGERSKTLDSRRQHDDYPELSDGTGQSSQSLPPMLVAVVVAPDAEHAGEARRAASKLERVGLFFQQAWLEEQRQALGDAYED